MYQVYNFVTLIFITILCLLYFIKSDKLQFEAANRYIDRCSGLVDKYWAILLILLFGVFLFTRFFRIDITPAGIHLDEMGYSYDAYSLAFFGTDRKGNAYPVLPACYGDGSSPSFTYMLMIALKFFPYSIKLMRSVMAISAIPCFIAAFFLFDDLFESKKWALLGPIFVIITPYFFTSERWGLNVNQMLTVCTIMLYFCIHAFKYNKTKDYVLTGIFLGLVFYTYVLAYVMMPIFFILVCVYLIYIKKFEIKKAIMVAVPFGVLGVPPLLDQLVNLGVLPEFHFLFSDYHRLSVYRLGEVSFLNIFKNLGNIIPLLFGGGDLSFNSMKEFGTMYWCMIPFVFVGAVVSLYETYKAIKNKTFSYYTIFTFYGISVYSIFILLSKFNIYNANSMYIEFIVLAAVGLRWLAGFYQEKKGNNVLLVISLSVIAISAVSFTNFYFRKQNDVYGMHPVFISTEPGDMIRYSEALYNPAGDKKVYMELNYNNRDYTDLLIALYTYMDPNVWRKHDNGEENMGHFYFYFPENYDPSENAIYILGHEWDHITSYLIGEGYYCDSTFEGYNILVK